jgi:hypothetical protein
MKYIVFTEFSNDDWDKLSEGAKKIWTEREKAPDKYPKKIFPDHFILGDLPTFTETIRGVTVYETDDPQQLKNVIAFWTAQGIKSVKRWFIPIHESDTDMNNLKQDIPLFLFFIDYKVSIFLT